MSKESSNFGRFTAAKSTGVTLLAALAFGAVNLPAFAQSSGLALLDTLGKGAWEIRYRDGSPKRKICVRSGQEMIRMAHPGKSCIQQSVKAGADELTVQYNCTGGGFGRTNIRRETSALVQLEGNGVADGLPYQFVAEARHVGQCV